MHHICDGLENKCTTVSLVLITLKLQTDFHLAEPQRVEVLLVKFKPEFDLSSRFLWDILVTCNQVLQFYSL